MLDRLMTREKAGAAARERVREVAGVFLDAAEPCVTFFCSCELDADLC